MTGRARGEAACRALVVASAIFDLPTTGHAVCMTCALRAGRATTGTFQRSERGVMSGGGNMGAGRASFSLSPACLSSCSAPAQCTHVVSSRPRTISTNPNPRTRLICVGSGEQEVRGETLHHGDDGGLGGVLGRVIDHVDVRAATARQPPGRPPSFVFEFIDVYRHDRGP